MTKRTNNYDFSLIDLATNNKLDFGNRKLRTIQLFAGYGSQNLALKYLGIDYEDYKISEWAIKSIQAYKDLHFEDDNTDYSKSLNKEQIVNYLAEKGISANYNDALTYEQIKRLSEDKLRTIYNNIIASHNLCSITNIKGQDLGITDTDKYLYLLTYSYPCQDCSVAGKQKGMSENSNTRSSLLWQLKRILLELLERELPQILLLENVTQIHNKKNNKDFIQWKNFLKSLGYVNYASDILASEYGIPQSRNRTFMVSILKEYLPKDYIFQFSKKKKLKLKLKDLLEDYVNEKYFLSEKMTNFALDINEVQKGTKWNNKTNDSVLNPKIAKCLTTRSAGGNLRADVANYICENLIDNMKIKDLKKILVRDKSNNLFIINNSKQLKETIENNFFKENTSLDLYNRACNYNISQTIDTGYHNSQRVVVKDIKNNNNYTQLRIRKLLPIECFRLMGVKDKDFYKIAKNQIDSSLYHLAGDSIVCYGVLTSIFAQLFNIDTTDKINTDIEWWKT